MANRRGREKSRGNFSPRNCVFPEQVSFHLKPGRTRDLRRHVKVYVLRSNVKWKVE